ncbi:30S ribosomal protein S4 [Candidatus Pacearchaeota archaeon ex4484_26]|nr:MAG: 30S ribosomal protein S4 [Candidatus Pacearchaeota archaeon ex4484_26]
MGDPRKLKKKYKKPKVKHEKDRIFEEKKILQKYGLKNKKEIWKAESKVSRIRNQAKRLLTASEEEQKKFLERLSEQGLIQAKTVDDVLELKTENILDRRLQTIVANKYRITAKHARQAIVHGHVKVGGKKVNIPSYFVNLASEKKVFYKK